MHGWSYEHNHTIISFNYNGGMDSGEVFITVPDCDEYVEHRAPVQGYHGKQVCLKIPAEAIVQLVFLQYIVPRLIGLLEGDVAGWFDRLTGGMFWSKLGRLADT